MDFYSAGKIKVKVQITLILNVTISRQFCSRPEIIIGYLQIPLFSNYHD